MNLIVKLFEGSLDTIKNRIQKKKLCIPFITSIRIREETCSSFHFFTSGG
jgi:uncharacterized membrane protein